MHTLHSAQQQHNDTCSLSKYKHKLICSLINLGISDLLFQAVFFLLSLWSWKSLWLIKNLSSNLRANSLIWLKHLSYHLSPNALRSIPFMQCREGFLIVYIPPLNKAAQFILIHSPKCLDLTPVTLCFYFSVNKSHGNDRIFPVAQSKCFFPPIL